MSIAPARIRVTGHYIRKELRLAAPARRLAVMALVIFVASFAAYRLHAIALAALEFLLVLVAALACGACLIALGGLARVWHRGHRGGTRALQALCISLLVLAPFGALGALAIRNPPVNVAMTDGLLDDEAAPDAASAGERTLIKGRRFPATAPQVYKIARRVLDEAGWQIADVVAGDPPSEGALSESGSFAGTLPGEEGGDLGVSGTVDIPIPTARSAADAAEAADPFARPDSERYEISALARDVVFALPSDVTIQIAEDDGETEVDLRSVSRDVAFDLGQNRRFIAGFLDRLDEAMTGIAASTPAQQ